MKALWSTKALNEFQAIYEYIKSESPQNAVLVFDKIYDLAISLPNFPY